MPTRLKALESVNLHIKLLVLLIVGLLLFFPLTAFISAEYFNISTYISIIVAVIVIVLHLFIRGHKELLLWLWVSIPGYALYFMICTILVSYGVSLVPFVSFNSRATQWIYLMILPVRVLAAVCASMIFTDVTSPAEFLVWGKFGLGCAFLMRGIEVTTENLIHTQNALLMQNRWPSDLSVFRPATAWFAIKQSVPLVIIALRNVILWAPWAWVCYTRITTTLKGDSQ